VNSRTHDLWAKKWTGLAPQKIKDINRAIDNPTRISARVQRQTQQKSTTGYNNPFDILQLGRHSGHRQVNHDVLNSMYTGFAIAGVDGARAGLVHYMLDGLSDQWKQKFGGAKGRDLIEAVMNYNAIED
jgi:hypothetical protein